MENTINDARRDIQLEALEALAKNNYNGFAQLPTGTGKAWVLIQVLKAVNPDRCWYLCDSRDNRDRTFKEELRKWGAEEWIDKIEFMCYQSAYKMEGEHVTLGLCDEIDMALTPAYSKTFFNNTFEHCVCTSGTLDKTKQKILQDIVPIVYERSIQEMVDTGVLNDANYWFVNYKLNKWENDRYLHFNRRFAQLLNSEKGRSSKRRLEMLQIERKHFLSGLDSSKNICRKLIKDIYRNPDNKVLIFCGLSEQADSICKYSYHSNNKDKSNLRDFDDGNIRVITVVNKVDRGQNLKGVNNIIFESPTKSSTKFSQRSGRGRRLEIGDTLDIYFLIPYFKNNRGQLQATVVDRWVRESTKRLNFEPKIYKFR